MRLLILGGTKFLGRHLVSAALARGFAVTTFNRGTRSGLAAGVEELHGDRNEGVAGLRALQGRVWDAVIDTCGYLPRIVSASAQTLRGQVGRYVFVSSISVYDTFDAPPSESSKTAELADPASEDIARDYGALKAACERVVEDAFGARALSVRPGLIVGPFDPTGRFTYWPLRLARGGEVLAPDDPAGPVQFIDARDLAEWIVALVERGVGGVFNATGPAAPLRFDAFLAEAARALGAECRFTWADAAFLKANDVQSWVELPVWADDAPGLARTRIDRALSEGLRFRPLAETVRDTFVWAESALRSGQKESLGTAGLAADKEAAVLAAWHRRTQ